MFDISDDDDDLFWQNLPVEEITNAALNSADGKRQAQDTLGHTETKRPRPSQSEHVSHHAARNTSVVNGQDASTQKSLQTLSNSNQFKGSENIPPCVLEQIDPHTASLELGSSGKHTDAGAQRIGGGRSSVSTPGPTTPGAPGRLASSCDSTPLPGPSPDSSTPRPSTRKFPGPAGLLPQQSPSVIITDTETSSSADKSSGELPLLSSQSGDTVFQEAPWQALMTDLGDDCLRVLKKFSLAAARFLASRKRLYQGKVPLVMAVLETVNVQDMAASVVLRDRSGQMQGSIHKDLLKEHGCDLHPGAVIVLRQVGVLSPTSRTHYLNITPANLVALYPNREGGTACVKPRGQPLELQAIIQAEERQTRKSLPPTAQQSTTPTRPAASQQHTPSSSARVHSGLQQSFSQRVGLQRGQTVSRPMQNCGMGNAQNSWQTLGAQSGPSPSLGGSSNNAASAGIGGADHTNFGTPVRSMAQPAHTRLANPGMGRGPMFSPGVPNANSVRASTPRSAASSGSSSAAGNSPASGQAGAARFRFRTPTTPTTPVTHGSQHPLPSSSSTPTPSRAAPPHASCSRGGGSSAATAAGGGMSRGGRGGDRSITGGNRELVEEAANVPDSMWEPWSDDLSDELLSQLSEDMF